MRGEGFVRGEWGSSRGAHPRNDARVCVCARGGGCVVGRESGWGSWGSGVWARVWWWGGLSRPVGGPAWLGRGPVGSGGLLFLFFLFILLSVSFSSLLFLF